MVIIEVKTSRKASLSLIFAPRRVTVSISSPTPYFVFYKKVRDYSDYESSEGRHEYYIIVREFM